MPQPCPPNRRTVPSADSSETVLAMIGARNLLRSGLKLGNWGDTLRQSRADMMDDRMIASVPHFAYASHNHGHECVACRAVAQLASTPAAKHEQHAILRDCGREALVCVARAPAACQLHATVSSHCYSKIRRIGVCMTRDSNACPRKTFVRSLPQIISVLDTVQVNLMINTGILVRPRSRRPMYE